MLSWLEHEIPGMPQADYLVARKKLKAYSAVAAGFLIFSSLVVMFSIRAPLSV
jgi:hypothetical protein